MKEILNLIKERRSVRDFSEKSISEEDILTIFEGARWAPSSYNGQPWKYIYAEKNRNPELHETLLNILESFNQAWAKAAPLIIIAMANTKYDKTGVENKHSWYDLALSVENMCLVAESLDISTHQITGFDVEKAITNLNIPSDFTPVVMIAMGYYEKTGNLPLDVYKMENIDRVRKDVCEFILDKKFDE